MLKKSIIALCAFLVLALVIGCSADSIMNLGSSLGKLSDATLVPRNPYYVEKATENVEAFIEESEKAFEWHDAFDPEKKDGYLKFKSDEMKTFYRNTVDETVNLLLSARDSSASDKALRNALNAKYEGLSYGKSDARKKVFDILVRDEAVGDLLEHLTDDDKRANLIMLLAFWGIRVNGEQLKTIKDVAETLKTANMPMPLQESDYYIMLTRRVFEQIRSIGNIIKSNSGSDPGDKPKIDMSVFTKFLDDIKASVGSRDYQTVGDKIAFGIVSCVMDIMIEVKDAFEKSCPDPDNPDYKFFFDYVFENDSAKASMDKILSYFDALSYIYNSKLDIAGLVSGAF